MHKARKQLAVLWKWRRIEARRGGLHSPMCRILSGMIRTRLQALRCVNIVIPLS